jgi:hypothetical protein
MLALSILPSRSDVSTPQNTSGIPGKMVSPVPQQEVQRRAHDRDDEIDRLAGVSPLIVIAERAIGAGIPELRRPQRFRVEIDVAQKFHRETRAQAVVEDGEARELLVLIVDDQDVLRCRVGCRESRTRRSTTRHNARCLIVRIASASRIGQRDIRLRPLDPVSRGRR